MTTSCNEGVEVLTRWERDFRELVNVEGQDVAKVQKIGTVNCLIQIAVVRDMEKDNDYPKFCETWKCFVKQLHPRRDCQPQRVLSQMM